MSSDGHKNNTAIVFLKKRTVISSDVDTPPARKLFMHGVIIEKRVMRLLEKEILSLYKFLANAFRQLAERLEELAMENRFHACL